MKRALLVVAFLAVVWALPVLGQGRQGGAGSAGEQAAAEALEAARKPPVEDFKPSVLNQPGRQHPEVNSERRVRARVVAPEANNVAFELLGGVRYPLTKGADGAWTGVTAPQDEGFHYYQLIIDGAQVPDPNTLYFYGANRWGSAVEVPAHDADFFALKNVPHGNLRQVQFYANSAATMARVFVYTPPDYEKGTKKYPVLYLQHGAGENEYGWGSQGFAGLILDNLIAAGKAKPFIIVIANGGGIPGGGRRGAPVAGGPPRLDFTAFERYLIDDLVPFIDANYRTLANQPNRAMAGLSMGGMQTRSIAPKHIDKFSHIGIFSGGSVPPSEVADMAAFKKAVTLVFVGYGGKENGAVGKANVEAMNKAGVKSVYSESPETGHEWLTWRRALHEFAPLLFQSGK